MSKLNLHDFTSCQHWHVCLRYLRMGFRKHQLLFFNQGKSEVIHWQASL